MLGFRLVDDTQVGKILGQLVFFIEILTLHQGMIVFWLLLSHHLMEERPLILAGEEIIESNIPGDFRQSPNGTRSQP